MRADLEALAKKFCPDGSVPVAEEREHATGDGNYTSVAYLFPVGSLAYLINFRNVLDNEFPDTVRSAFKPDGIALRPDLGRPSAMYISFLGLRVHSGQEKGLVQPSGIEVDVHALNVSNAFYGRMIKDGEALVGVEYVKTSPNGIVGELHLLLVGIYRKEEQTVTTDTASTPTDLPPPITK